MSASSENSRLKLVRQTIGLTQKQFAESLEIKQGSYSDVERGKAGISALLLRNLIKRYQVNPLWLCDGEGSMFIGESKAPKQPNGKPKEAAPAGAAYNLDVTALFAVLEYQREQLEELTSVVEFIGKD
jgi:transcriptional regulator with XRE-family HTH domain